MPAAGTSELAASPTPPVLGRETLPGILRTLSEGSLPHHPAGLIPPVLQGLTPSHDWWRGEEAAPFPLFPGPQVPMYDMHIWPCLGPKRLWMMGEGRALLLAPGFMMFFYKTDL